MRKLEDELKAYSGTDMYPFHMPGHKRRGNAVFRTDITEIDGFDSLHDPEGILLEEMTFAADFYGTKDTFFLVGGSTCGILAAISAAVPAGGRILISRRSHISVYHAAYLRNLEIGYLEDEEARDRKADAVVLTSPSYEGCMSDVRAYAERAGQTGSVLIVDEAHGAHLSMHPYFPESAVKLGADLVIQSTHKTLPAMTQTALLHNVSGRVSRASLVKFLRIYESSSPSYVLMSSIASAVHAAAEGGRAYFDGYVRMLKEIREDLADGLAVLSLAGGAEGRLRGDELPPYPAGCALDPGKLVILVPDGKGSCVYDALRERFHLQPEMRTPDYVLLMTSVNDTREGFARLREALFELDREMRRSGGETAEEPPAEAGQRGPGPAGNGSVLLPPSRMPLAAAWDAAGEEVPLKEAEGRISADFCIVFPPDSPVIVPGEEFTAAVISRIAALEEREIPVTGVTGDGQVRCLPDGNASGLARNI